MFRKLITDLSNRLCPRKLRKSYALNQLDLKLEPYLRRRTGFFVEAGGNDGIRQSNTLYFEKYLGWSGLLIEAIPALAQKCRLNRPRCAIENCALVSSSYTDDTIEMYYRNLMSIVKGGLPDAAAEARHIALGEQCMRHGDLPCTLSVPAKTLNSVLDEHGVTQIDLLSLDVEGYEIEVLQGIDFERHKPVHLLVEVRDLPAMEKIVSPWYRQVDVLSQNLNYSDILYALKK